MQPDPVLTNLRKGVLEHCVLALLRDDEVYGVDLAHCLVEAGLLASEGSLYPLLARLRSAGMVSTRWQESPSGPPRRYYRFTPVGLSAVDRFISIWRPFSNAVDTIFERTS